MPQPPPAGQVALVVDDLLLNRVLLAGALRRLGYEVVQSADGPDALRQLGRREFAVVFLDWDLPGLGGDEVAALIRERPRPVPIIAITADESPEMRARCQRAGVTGFLGKTFDFARLRAVLAALSPEGGPEAEAGAAWRGEGLEGSASATAMPLAALWARSGEHLSLERAKLAEALRAERTTDALRALHNLTSLANMVGASPVGDAARAVEARLRGREPWAEALTGLDAALARFRPAPATGLDADAAR